jgi:hypothetical protein
LCSLLGEDSVVLQDSHAKKPPTTLHKQSWKEKQEEQEQEQEQKKIETNSTNNLLEIKKMNNKAKRAFLD